MAEATTTAHDTNESLSEYELLRQQKIQRNQEKLRALGLLTEKAATAKRPQKKKTTPQSRRVSLRLRGIDPFPMAKKNSNNSDHPLQRPPWSEENHPSPMTLMPHPPPNPLVDLTNANDAVDRSEPTRRTITKPSKTTTREHCWMRIRTMSIPQLEQRIRIIERARGRHSIEKLAIMVECCQDANLIELAQQAQDAIQRLTGRK